MSTCIFIGILHKLLKLAPSALRFLNCSKALCLGLALGQLRADKVKDRGYTLPDLDTPIIPSIPILDQVLKMLLGVYLHYCTTKSHLSTRHQGILIYLLFLGLPASSQSLGFSSSKFSSHSLGYRRVPSRADLSPCGDVLALPLDLQ